MRDRDSKDIRAEKKSRAGNSKQELFETSLNCSLDIKSDHLCKAAQNLSHNKRKLRNGNEIGKERGRDKIETTLKGHRMTKMRGQSQ